MSSSLRFITTNPTTEAFAKGEQRRAQRLQAESTEFAIDEARRRSGEEQQQDAAIRAAVVAPAAPPQSVTKTAPPPDYASEGIAGNTEGAPQVAAPPQRQSVTERMTQNLARVPGGGRIALGLTQNAERKRDQDETNVMHYLSNPSTAHVGMALAQKIGMQIPPVLAQNTAFWQGSSIAKQLYGNDMAAAQKFASTFAHSQQADINTKVQEAISAAGAPVKKKQYGVVTGDQGLVFYNLENPADTIKGPARPGTTMVNDRGETVHAPATGGEVTPFTQGGQPLRGQRFGVRTATGGAPRQTVYEQKKQGWLAAYPGDEKGALEYAAGRRKLGPAEEERIASTIAKNEAGQSMTPIGPEALRQRTQEILAEWRKPVAAPAPAPAAAAPAPAVPAPAATPASPKSFPYEADMGGRPIFSQDGKKWVYEDGTPVQ